MTISKGSDWGDVVARPADLRVAASDHDLATMLADGSGQPTAVSAGDVHRTVGGRPLDDRDELLSLPIDLMRVSLDDAEPVAAVAHVLARSPWRAGGWWRGEVLAVMNAEFVGDLDVAPRGHPNDGRAESFHVGAQMGLRQRWEVRRRLPSARHLPHPEIAVRPIRSMTWDFDRQRAVVVDGRGVGCARRLTVHVDADAAVLYA
ncbi:MAG: hypothetical protein WA964_08360 [Ilumatobacter sp.]|uniref:hypothetical protein n=1 Tax=Ilumatobacter sp. TaxID=1967498 RepID=UPI003C72D14D